MPGATERLMRRIQHMAGFGRTAAPVDDTGAVQRVQIQTFSGVPVSGVPVASLFGLSSVMPVGSDVVFVSVAGDSSAMVAVTTGHQGSRPKGTPAGGTVLYDQIGSNLLLSNDGNATLKLTGTFTIKIGDMTAVFSAAGLAITEGKITSDGDQIAGFGTADQVTQLGHKHASTGATSPTSVPIAGT